MPKHRTGPVIGFATRRFAKVRSRPVCGGSGNNYIGVCQDKTGTNSGVFVPDVVGKCEMGTESSYSVPISMEVIPQRAMVAG